MHDLYSSTTRHLALLELCAVRCDRCDLTVDLDVPAGIFPHEARQEYRHGGECGGRVLFSTQPEQPLTIERLLQLKRCIESNSYVTFEDLCRRHALLAVPEA